MNSPRPLPKHAEGEPFSGAIERLHTPVRVLVADDESLNRRLIRRYLEKAGMTVLEAVDGHEALASLREATERVDVLVLDMLMPGLSGKEVLDVMRADPALNRVPVLIASNLSSLDSRTDLLTHGATDFLHKPVRSGELVARIKTMARLARSREALDGAGRALLAMGQRVESRDDDLAGHCGRLSRISVALGREFDLSERALVALDRAGALHDIGKLVVPESILLKAGPLKDWEWQVMRGHPAEGERMIAGVPCLADVRPIVRHHHERWDGSGYPDGLAGESIPLTARLFRLADAYDALRGRRVFKRAYSHEEAVAELRAETRRGWWEPGLVDRCADLLGELMAEEPVEATLRMTLPDGPSSTGR